MRVKYVGEFAHAGRLSSVVLSVKPEKSPAEKNDPDVINVTSADKSAANPGIINVTLTDKDTTQKEKMAWAKNQTKANPDATGISSSSADKDEDVTNNSDIENLRIYTSMEMSVHSNQTNGLVMNQHQNQDQYPSAFSEDRFILVLDEEARSILKSSQANFPEDQHFSLDMLEQKPKIYHDLFKKALNSITARGIRCENAKLICIENKGEDGKTGGLLSVSDVVFPGLHPKSLLIYKTLDRICRELEKAKQEEEKKAGQSKNAQTEELEEAKQEVEETERQSKKVRTE
mmetsp:Transcript_7636/g.9704  ORF Transcript_7636/g.9704 Transcript_7636/m.9704 type:complete len:288 (-) Transcript_7636:1356-2219(-)